MTTFVDDCVVLSTEGNSVTNLENNTNLQQPLFRKPKIKINTKKSTHVKFTHFKKEFPAILFGNEDILNIWE